METVVKVAGIINIAGTSRPPFIPKVFLFRENSMKNILKLTRRRAFALVLATAA